MSRRGESIYKRKDGRWEARYIHHYENGKAKYRYLYANTYTEVKSKKLEAIKNLTVFDTDLKQEQKVKFKELSEMWLNTLKNTVKESTLARYHYIVHNYLIKEFENEEVNRIDSIVLNNYAFKLLNKNDKTGKSLSSKTATDILGVMKSILKFGRILGYPCQIIGDLKIVPKPKNKIKILSDYDRKALEDKLFKSNNRVSLGILLTLYTGIRIGELCGLKHGDLDLQNNILSIRRTVERIADLNPSNKSKTKLIITEPKTETSIRTIPLPNFLVLYIKQFDTNSNKYVLTGTEKNTEPHQFYLRYKTFMRKNNFGNYTFHALRHTFASVCIEKGFDVKSLSEILGHSNITTTLSIYVHSSFEQKRILMERLNPHK